MAGVVRGWKEGMIFGEAELDQLLTEMGDMLADAETKEREALG